MEVAEYSLLAVEEVSVRYMAKAMLEALQCTRYRSGEILGNWARVVREKVRALMRSQAGQGDRFKAAAETVSVQKRGLIASRPAA